MQVHSQFTYIISRRAESGEHKRVAALLRWTSTILCPHDQHDQGKKSGKKSSRMETLRLRWKKKLISRLNSSSIYGFVVSYIVIYVLSIRLYGTSSAIYIALKLQMSDFCSSYCKWLSSGYTSICVLLIMCAYWSISIYGMKHITPSIQSSKLVIIGSPMEQVHLWIWLNYFTRWCFLSYCPIIFFLLITGWSTLLQ